MKTGKTKMNKLRITISGEPAKKLVSNRTGKDFTLLEVYVHAGAPYPEKVVIFDDIRLARGIYDVPFSIRVRNERLEFDFNFEQAEQVK